MSRLFRAGVPSLHCDNIKKLHIVLTIAPFTAVVNQKSPQGFGRFSVGVSLAFPASFAIIDEIRPQGGDR
jgi:hypothetical protein